MARSRSSFRYVCSRSSVQQPNGSPRLSGFSSATAMTSPICSAVYVGGRPDRGWSCKPSSPRALNRVIHFRTTWGVTRTIRAMSDTHHPSADQAMMVARSRSRTDPARVPRQASIVARSASLSSRTRSFMSRSFIAAPQHDFCLPIVLSWRMHQLGLYFAHEEHEFGQNWCLTGGPSGSEMAPDQEGSSTRGASGRTFRRLRPQTACSRTQRKLTWRGGTVHPPSWRGRPADPRPTLLWPIFCPNSSEEVDRGYWRVSSACHRI